jgi:hypothetical protein
LFDSNKLNFLSLASYIFSYSLKDLGTRIKIVICVPIPKSAYFSSESEFSGRGVAEAQQLLLAARILYNLIQNVNFLDPTVQFYTSHFSPLKILN